MATFFGECSMVIYPILAIKTTIAPLLFSYEALVTNWHCGFVLSIKSTHTMSGHNHWPKQFKIKPESAGSGSRRESLLRLRR